MQSSRHLLPDELTLSLNGFERAIDYLIEAESLAAAAIPPNRVIEAPLKPNPSTSTRSILKSMVDINNASIGPGNFVHAISSTFPDNFTPTAVLATTTGVELAFFTLASLILNCSNDENNENIKQSIQRVSSASNAFVFTYGMSCEIVALIAGDHVKLTDSMIGVLASVLLSSVAVGGLTLYRDVTENQYKKHEITPSTRWKNMSKVLDSGLLFLAAFNLFNQVLHLLNSTEKTGTNDSDIIPVIKIVLLFSALVMPIVGLFCKPETAKKMTYGMGALGNGFRESVMVFNSTLLPSPAAEIIIGARMTKFFNAGMSIASNQCKKSAKNSSIEAPLLDQRRPSL